MELTSKIAYEFALKQLKKMTTEKKEILEQVIQKFFDEDDSELAFFEFNSIKWFDIVLDENMNIVIKLKQNLNIDQYCFLISLINWNLEDYNSILYFDKKENNMIIENFEQSKEQEKMIWYENSNFEKRLKELEQNNNIIILWRSLAGFSYKYIDKNNLNKDKLLESAKHCLSVYMNNDKRHKMIKLIATKKLAGVSNLKIILDWVVALQNDYYFAFILNQHSMIKYHNFKNENDYNTFLLNTRCLGILLWDGRSKNLEFEI